MSYALNPTQILNMMMDTAITLPEINIAYMRMAHPDWTQEALAKELGVKPHCVSSALARARVKRFIYALQMEMARDMGKTAEDITKDFVEIQERCMQAKEVVDKEGNPTGEWTFDANNAIRATENLAKHIGYYEKDNEQQAGPRVIEVMIEGTSIQAKAIPSAVVPEVQTEAPASLPEPEKPATEGEGPSPQ